MTWLKSLAVIGVIAIAGGVFLHTSCRIGEGDYLDVVPLSEVLPDVGPDELRGAPCSRLCTSSGDWDSINGCRLARLAVERHIVCILDNPRIHDRRSEQRLPFPEGLEPASEGVIDNKWCDERTCVSEFNKSWGDAPDEERGITRSRCEVEERPASFDASETYVVCSYHDDGEIMILPTTR